LVVIVTNTASAGNPGQAFLKALGMLAFILFCPRRVAENGNGNFFFPRRAAKNGNGNTFCPQRTRRTRRATENGNGNGNGNFFFPRRAAKDREERQRQHLLSTEDTEGHGGPRRTATATATSFFHEGTRRTAKNGNGNTFCPQRTRRATENGNCNFFLSTKGREGPRRTATATAASFWSAKCTENNFWSLRVILGSFGADALGVRLGWAHGNVDGLWGRGGLVWLGGCLCCVSRAGFGRRRWPAIWYTSGQI